MGRLKEYALAIDEELALIESYDPDTWPPSVAARHEELSEKIRLLNPPADFAAMFR